MIIQEKYKLLKEKYNFDEDYWQRTLESKGLPLIIPIEKFYDLITIDINGVVYTPSIEVLYQNGLENEANYQAYLAQKNAPIPPTTEQILERNITDIEIANIKSNRQLTDLEIACIKKGVVI